MCPSGHALDADGQPREFEADGQAAGVVVRCVDHLAVMERAICFICWRCDDARCAGGGEHLVACRGLVGRATVRGWCPAWARRASFGAV